MPRLTVEQQALKMLSRMSVAAAATMATRYAEQTEDPSGSTAEYWARVSDYILQLNREGKAQNMVKKASKSDPTATSSQDSSDTATAQPSNEELAQERVTDVCKALDRKMTQAHNIVAQHIEALKKNAAQALEWSHSVFKAAAQISVFTQVIQGLTTDDGKPTAVKTRSEAPDKMQTWGTVPYVLEYAQKEVNRRSQNASSSTSPTSNLMDREILAAWAEVIEIISWR